MENPLLQDWSHPFQIAPFDSIRDDDFAPALDKTLKINKTEILKIANNTESPTFKNTIEALLSIGDDFEKIVAVFYTLNSADTNQNREKLMLEFSKKLTAHYSELVNNQKLFKRIKTIWNKRTDFELSDEQERVLMLTHRNFVRSGAYLKKTQKKLMDDIRARLAILTTKFSQNLLADERSWHITLSAKDLSVLPRFLINSAKTAARDKGVRLPIITLSRSLIVPFLQFSPNRKLRKIAYKAWTSRGAKEGPTNNKTIAKEILDLRQEMAKILDYQDFATFKLEIEMAKTTQNVHKLLNKVWDRAKIAAKREEEKLTALMHQDGINGKLKKWDWHYYAEKLKNLDYDLDEVKIEHYFELKQIIKAAFYCAKRLFDLDFRAIDVPLYHPDCSAWEVTRNGEHLAIFIGDYFARSSKRSGAWCSSLREQAKFPRKITPIVINTCNFAKGDPTLLSLDDAQTLFHEFGHALHKILSDVTYQMVSGTSVSRDFVELPSQLYEHWLEVPSVLEKFAISSVTGKPMPLELQKKLFDISTFDIGFKTVEYLASAIVDLELHKGKISDDLILYQENILQKIGMPEAIGMRHATLNFAHIFSGAAYASGYYSYMWSEIMEADAFTAFLEQGNVFDPNVARSLQDNILSKGGSKDPEELYEKFRGRLPEVDAFLKSRKLL